MPRLPACRALSALVAACVLAGCGHHPGRISAIAGLRLSDLPNVFTTDETRSWGVPDSARSVGASAQAFRSHGGQESYEQTFVPKQPVGEGVSFVTARTFAFRNATGARWAFTVLRTTLAHSGVNGTEQVHPIVYSTPAAGSSRGLDQAEPQNATPYQVAKVPRVAEQDAGFTVVSVSGGGETAYENHAILFREGRYCATVRIAGVFQQVPWSMVVGLARRIDDRMKQ